MGVKYVNGGMYLCIVGVSFDVKRGVWRMKEAGLLLTRHAEHFGTGHSRLQRVREMAHSVGAITEGEDQQAVARGYDAVARQIGAPVNFPSGNEAQAQTKVSSGSTVYI